MNLPLEGAVYPGLLLAGLAGSLHCLGMCGPILLAFGEVGGSAQLPASRRALDSLLYHAGRVWTYAVLGLLAGWAGSQARVGAELLGWQRPLAVAASVLVLLSGLAAFGWLPGLRLDLAGAGGCSATLARWPWLSAMLRTRSPLARLLLGAVMGLLPCGLVYAMLVVVATLPTPLHAGLGMAVFGLGTFPALTALLLTLGVLPARVRRRGSRFAAVLLLIAGAVMLARAFGVHLH